MSLPKLAIRLAGVVVVAVVVVLLLSSGSQHYTVNMHLANALGLRSGSPVVEGGVKVGSVTVKLEKQDVLVSAKIDKKYAPLGRNASAEVIALNLLGEQSLQLNPGNRSQPAPSGFSIPADRVTPGTELDQVLDVLSPTTADQLEILINEAGTAVAGRRMDISQIISELPGTAQAATALVNQLASNNDQLADLIQRTNGVVSTVNGRQRQLGNLIDTFGQSSKTVEAQDANLQSTLVKLPGTLTTARAFLAKLQNTTVPLGPAARDISAVAPGITSVLAQLKPFTAAAWPTLAKALSISPELTELGHRATPVLQAAEPTLSALAGTSTDLEPVTGALDKSVDNILATAWNWTHAIEERDALSHVFRAEVGVTDQTVKEVVNRLLAVENSGSSSAARTHSPGKSSSPGGAAGSTLSGIGSTVTGTTSNLSSGLSGVVSGLSNTLSGVAGGLSGTTSKLGSTLSGTLGGLGQNGGHRNGTTSSSTTTSNQQLSTLLKYLL